MNYNEMINNLLLEKDKVTVVLNDNTILKDIIDDDLETTLKRINHKYGRCFVILDYQLLDDDTEGAIVLNCGSELIFYDFNEEGLKECFDI